jgi:hypothetical protein
MIHFRLLGTGPAAPLCARGKLFTPQLPLPTQQPLNHCKRLARYEMSCMALPPPSSARVARIPSDASDASDVVWTGLK